MTVKSIGGRGRTSTHNSKGAVSGIGVASTIPDLGWSGFVGKNGDVAYVPFASICSVIPNLGIYAQSDVAATLEFSLANPALAANSDPAVADTAPWGNDMTLAAGVAQQLEVAFTVCKITFGGSGAVYFVAR